MHGITNEKLTAWWKVPEHLETVFLDPSVETKDAKELNLDHKCCDVKFLQRFLVKVPVVVTWLYRGFVPSTSGVSL